MEDSTVLYNLPGQHSFVRTDPNGVYWVYEIVDVTTPYGSPLDIIEPQLDTCEFRD